MNDSGEVANEMILVSVQTIFQRVKGQRIRSQGEKRTKVGRKTIRKKFWAQNEIEQKTELAEGKEKMMRHQKKSEADAAPWEDCSTRLELGERMSDRA